MSEITFSMLDEFSKEFNAERANLVGMRAAMKSGLSAAAENQKEQVNNPMTFSIQIETGDITNQKQSGRCWLFAALNCMRFQIMKKLNLKTFELSQNYQMFWDKLEKANYFLDSIEKTASEPADGRLIAHLLSSPVGDGGQWDMYCAIADKYGCVPKYVMPETFQSSATGMMVTLITAKLREDAKVLREMIAAGKDVSEAKREMLGDIYKILVTSLGEPPKKFTFEARDKDDKFIRDEGITPKEFFDKYVGLALTDYVSCINAPTADKPYNKTFTVDYLGNVVGGREVKYLNLTSDELREMAIKQLSDGEPVWFGCDVGKMLMRDYGIMGTHTYDYESLLGVKFNLDKAGRLDFGESVMTHAMVFLGVNIVDGKPNRWKVENSWGDKAGQDGYYIMTDEWFGEYMYQVVVNKKYLTEAQRELYEQKPMLLKPWDPMGSLA